MELITSLIDFILHIDKHLSEIIRDYQVWTYLILFLIIFAETGFVVTPFLPGDSLLFAAGALIGAGDTGLSIYLLALLLFIAAVLGDTVNYEIGKYYGAKAFSGKIKFLKKEYLTKTQDFFAKHGGKTIIYARFVPIVRTFAPFVAGIGEMTYKKFISFNVVGGFVWVGIFLFLGYFFGNMAFIQKNFSLVILVIIFISLLPAVIEIVRGKNKTA
ncbi:SNARE associated Golgi protein-like protein [Pseudopedobacter saltans DSM 12145]|uniref:SNARE associated Golgi protein-like protein n=1 Tax=Pseudopedobacter saltans (strain ATCC 51119 / DSM 12145 / JCM 21818 / CCUG 39354 / LMG 10337 / NBRC 100064 / NCIMB 13643) TaxID=762903 RepID=F0S6H9_PSESL|nr:DedA family protein [Pseudopedobacter saltans]ADY54305.1 SNARE associated Golgi protein-like protein [Pseudopedobacter saltans DSM 12145]